jgi:predicted dehydrogenase
MPVPPPVGSRSRRRLDAVCSHVVNVRPVAAAGLGNGPIRIGIIGLDTSHSPAYCGALNTDSPSRPEFAGFRVTTAVRRGSGAETFRIAPTIQSSVSRIPGYVKEVEALGVEVVSETSSNQIDEMLGKVDAVCLETNDGAPRLEQALQVLRSRTPMFVDKPVAKDFADTLAIYAVAQALDVPIFSASSLRWCPGVQSVRGGSVGRVLGADTFGPAHYETEHRNMPDFFWYGIHAIEMLVAVMGPGLESVTRTSTAETDVVVGKWSDGRLGTFRGSREVSSYGGNAFGSEGVGELGPCACN